MTAPRAVVVDRRRFAVYNSNATWAAYAYESFFHRVAQVAHPNANRLLPKTVALDEAEAARRTYSILERWVAELPVHFEGYNLNRVALCKAAGYNGALGYLLREQLRAETICSLLESSRVTLYGGISPFGSYFIEACLKAGHRAISVPPAMASDAVRRLAWRASYRLGYYPEELPLRAQVLEPPGDKVRVLTVGSSPTYLGPLTAVNQSIEAVGECGLLLVPHEGYGWSRSLRLEDFGVRTALVEGLFSVQHDKEQLKQRFETEFLTVSRRLEALVGSTTWQFFRHGIRDVYVNLFPFIVRCLRAAERAFDLFRPEVLVVGRLRRAFDRSFAAVARRRAIPCVVVPHGYPGMEIDGAYDLADRVCTWGQPDTEIIRLSAPRCEIIQTGNPQWKRMPSRSQRPELRARVAEQLAIDRDKPWLVLLAAITEEMFPELVWVLEQLPQVQLIVKHHPLSLSRHVYAPGKSTSAESRITHVSHETALHELLVAADACITWASTTEIEACLAGTPLILISFESIRYRERTSCLKAERYGVPVATSKEALVTILGSLLSGDPTISQQLATARTRVEEDYAACADGGATNRVRDAVLTATFNEPSVVDAMAGASR